MLRFWTLQGLCCVQLGLRSFLQGFIPFELASAFSVHTDVAGKFTGAGEGIRYLTCAEGITEESVRSAFCMFVLPSAFGGGLGLLPPGTRLLFLNTGFI